MYSLRSALATFLLCIVATSTFAELYVDDADKKLVVLFQDNYAETTFNVISSDSSEAPVLTSDNPIYTMGEITSTETSSGMTNYSIPLEFSTDVGVVKYTVKSGDESVSGQIVVAGITIKKDGEVMSGSEGKGIPVGIGTSHSLDVNAVGTDGSTVDISGAEVTAMNDDGDYFKEVDIGETSISSSSLFVQMAEARAGDGKLFLTITSEAISYAGEVFETQLNLFQDTSTASCAVVGGSYSATDGVVKIPMFNLKSPPLEDDVSSVEISVGSASAAWDLSASSMGSVDQTVAFEVAASGAATITCDGVDATVVGGPLEIVVPSGALAVDLVQDELSSGDDPILEVVLVIVGETTKTLLQEPAISLRESICEAAQGSDCRYVNMTDLGATSRAIVRQAGSMSLAIQTVISGDPKEAEENVNGVVDNCTAQQKAGYECPKVYISDTDVTNVIANAGVAATGLAMWTIVLIAGLGAFALIALIMLGLLFVYRRSAEQSESDYSSSGPLGVPDPSDLLYEQSIVRDIYGRGDFPEGGPSAAVAEERAREADRREEFPRPPSSSGLSRGSATDDASSTYSV